MKKNLTILLIVFSLSSCNYIMSLMGVSMSSKPEPMELMLPKNTAGKQIIPTDKTFTILVLGNDQFYAYKGKNLQKSVRVYDGKPFLHTAVQEGKKMFGKDFMVILKPSATSSYKDIVDALDEMTISNVKRYSLSEMNTEEKLFLEKLK